MKHFLRIENMLIAKKYQKLLNYLEELSSEQLLYQGIKLYLEGIIQNKQTSSVNPYYKFYYHDYKDLESQLMKLTDDFHNLYLGHLYIDDLKKAESFYRKADHIYQSKTYLALIYMKKQEYLKAKYLLETTENFVLSPFYLGKMYLNGYGVKQNINTAISYFTQSANLGFQDAKFILATTFKKQLNQKYGDGYSDLLINDLINKLHPQTILLQIDSTQGLKQMKIVAKAINSPDGDLKCEIGINYYYGKSLPQNKDLSRYWLDLAMQLNNEKAKKFLEDYFD